MADLGAGKRSAGAAGGMRAERLDALEDVDEGANAGAHASAASHSGGREMVFCAVGDGLSLPARVIPRNLA